MFACGRKERIALPQTKKAIAMSDRIPRVIDMRYVVGHLPTVCACGSVEETLFFPKKIVVGENLGVKQQKYRSAADEKAN